MPIALGTDAGGFDWAKLNQAEEFKRYVDRGMTPWQALRSATVTALTDCHLLELYQKDFLELIRLDTAMGVKLMLHLAQLLSRHLRKTNQDVVKLTTALAISLGG